MEKYTALIGAIAALFWPALVATVLVLLRTPIRDMIASRAITLEIGGIKVSVGSSIEQINKDLAELKAKFLQIDVGAKKDTVFNENTNESDGKSLVGGTKAPTLTRTDILWVDDKPDGNALAIAQLHSLGFDITIARSTEEGIQRVEAANPPFKLIISDIARTEGTGHVHFAGLELLRQLREGHIEIPVIFYTTDRTARMQPVREALLKDGNASATGSTTDLFSLINKALLPAS